MPQSAIRQQVMMSCCQQLPSISNGRAAAMDMDVDAHTVLSTLFTVRYRQDGCGYPPLDRQHPARCFGIYGREIYAPPYSKITEVWTKNEQRIYAHEKSCSCFLHRDMYDGNRLLRIINSSRRADSECYAGDKAQSGRRPILSL